MTMVTTINHFLHQYYNVLLFHVFSVGSSLFVTFSGCWSHLHLLIILPLPYAVKCSLVTSPPQRIRAMIPPQQHRRTAKMIVITAEARGSH